MELLLTLIAEFVASLVLPVIAVIIDFFATLLALIGFTLFGRRSRERTAADPTDGHTAERLGRATGTVVRSRRFAIGAGLFGAVFLALLAGVLVANFVFFKPTVNWLAGKVAERSGMEISFDNAEGNLLTGKLQLGNLNVQRRNTDKTEYRFSARQVAVDVEMLSLVFGDAELASLHVDGASGDIWTKPKKTDAGGDKRAKRQFEITDLGLSNVDVQLHRVDTPPLSLAISQFHTDNLRSRFVVYDVFFRSDINGTVNGNTFLVSSKRQVGGRSTRWQLDDFPAELVRHYVDKAPFKWFTGGTVDVRVDDHWTSADNAELDTSWDIVLKDVRVVEPDNSNLVEKALGTPIARYINSRDEDIDFSLRFVMDESQFEMKPSLDAAGVWDAVLEGTARALAENSKETADEIRTNLKQSAGKFKEFLNKRRLKLLNKSTSD